jgi:hypothetical protein
MVEGGSYNFALSITSSKPASTIWHLPSQLLYANFFDSLPILQQCESSRKKIVRRHSYLPNQQYRWWGFLFPEIVLYSTLFHGTLLLKVSVKCPFPNFDDPCDVQHFPSSIHPRCAWTNGICSREEKNNFIHWTRIKIEY